MFAGFTALSALAIFASAQPQPPAGNPADFTTGESLSALLGFATDLSLVYSAELLQPERSCCLAGRSSQSQSDGRSCAILRQRCVRREDLLRCL